MPAQLLVLPLLVSYAFALACAVAPWLARRLPGWLLVAALGLGLGASVLGAIGALPLDSWSDVPVLVVALAGGLLLGRVVAPRFRPMLFVLLVLSALDIAQIALTGGLITLRATSHAGSIAGPLLYGNVVLELPGRRYVVGIFDLLLLTALAEHWRRRGGGPLFALLPGVVGFTLGYALDWLTGLGGWPLIPFFTVGWLCSEAARLLFRSGTRGLAAQRKPRP